MSVETIIEILKSYGFSKAGMLGILANMKAESNLCSFRVQGDHSKDYMISRAFTEAADRGEKEDSFKTGGGYGLCQWGGGRKYGLLKLAQSRGVSVSDEALQVEYMWNELHDGNYPILLNTLLTTDNVVKAVNDFCKVFERPLVADVGNRLKKVKEFEKYFDEVQPLVKPQPAPTVGIKPVSNNQNAQAQSVQALIDSLKYGSQSKKVKDLQTKLIKLGYSCGNCGADGIYGKDTLKAVREFQEDGGKKNDT